MVKRNEGNSKTRKYLEVHKTDLIHYIQHTVGLSENKSKIIIKKVFEWITLNLALNHKVSIKEFGIFYNTYVKRKNCNHPTTQEEITISETARVVFKPEKSLKTKVQPALTQLNKDHTYTSPNPKVDKLFNEIREGLKYDPTNVIKQERHKYAVHDVRSSLLTYLKMDFPYGKDWIHPITYERYACKAIKTALLVVQELNPEQYRILWALWTTRKDSIYLSTRFYCSVQTIKRQWERAIDLLALILFFPELNADISNVTKLY